VRDHRAHPARLDPRRGLHDDPQPSAAPAVVLGDSDDVEAVEPDEQITPDRSSKNQSAHEHTP
jgi:hypothetical protein